MFLTGRHEELISLIAKLNIRSAFEFRSCPDCQERREPDNFFGLCEEVLGICEEHKTRWMVGLNIDGDKHVLNSLSESEFDELVDHWEQISDRLKDYREVEGVLRVWA